MNSQILFVVLDGDKIKAYFTDYNEACHYANLSDIHKVFEVRTCELTGNIRIL